MPLSFRELWRWEGTIGRGPYALIGLVGFALKHNLDRLLATLVFHRRWSAFNYWIPLDQAVRITSLSQQDSVFLASMLLLALPFIWIGVALTLRRLRAVRLPAWLVALFFLPVLNLLFFAVLSVLPSRTGTEEMGHAQKARGKKLFDRIIPDNAIGSAAMAILLTFPVGLALTLLGTTVLKTYGWGLFVALPFCLGLSSVLLYGYHHPRSYGNCLAVACLSPLLLGLALVAVAVEGVICLLMAAPIAGLLAMMGGAIGYFIQRRPENRSEAPAILSVLVFVLPAFLGAERAGAPESPLFAVRTAIEIDAPPEMVWKQVVAFAEIPEPTEWLFRLGIAYPVRAEIRGRGAGAVRRCVFSTGAFVEPIEVWQQPYLLKFSVASNPPPMQEWTPYSQVDAPHLRGFLVSRGGQFRLTPLPRGRTRLEGTTWYHHSMWPATYWRVWSGYIIHRIHLRVLRHIERVAAIQSSAEAAGGPLRYNRQGVAKGLLADVGDLGVLSGVAHGEEQIGFLIGRPLQDAGEEAHGAGGVC